MLKTLWAFWGCDDDLDIFGENFRQPECDVCLSTSLTVNELVNSFNNNYNLVIDLLGTVNHKLLFNLCTANIEPICKEFSNILFKQVHILLQFQSFSQFDDNSVKGVKIVAVIAAIAGKVHYWQNLFLLVRIQSLILLPVDQNSLYSTSGFCFKNERLVWIGIILNPARYFVDVLLLTWEKLFIFVMLNCTFAWTEINKIVTLYSWYTFRRCFSFKKWQFPQIFSQHFVRNWYLWKNFPLFFY